jgi:DNA-binding beta-propeller fold protein YncE
VYFPDPPDRPRAVHLVSFNDLAELYQPDAGGWSVLRGPRPSPHVGTPLALAYADPVLYICDTAANVVHAWNLLDGSGIQIGHGRLGKPVAVAVDRAGHVFVADTARASVSSFKTTGEFLRTLTPPGVDSFRPVALAVTEERLYAADADGRIHIYNTVTNDIARTIDGGAEPLAYPAGLTVARGRVFITEMMAGRVRVLDAEGVGITTIGSPGDRYGSLGSPRGVAVAPDGTLAVTDVGFQHVHLFDQQGRLLLMLGGPADRPGGTMMPNGIAIAEGIPEGLAWLIPPDFEPRYYVWVSNTAGSRRLALFAVGSKRTEALD